MRIDYHINLSKDQTSTPEARKQFYNGMLIYLCLCFAALVLVAYLSSINIRSYVENKQDQNGLMKEVKAVCGIEEDSFRNPDKIYKALNADALQLQKLKQVLGRRTHLLPVIHSLFMELPEGVVLQDLSANRNKIVFDLVMPQVSEEAGNPVRDLQKAWEENKDLKQRVATIRPQTGERRSFGGETRFFVQFECILKK
ncbi:MAG TPA: hypothetical protein VIR63_04910 [Pontiella sp.]